MANYKMQMLVCGGTGCKSAEADGIVTNLEKAIIANNLSDDVQVLTTGCFGFCEKGPVVKILPDNTFYVQVVPEDAEELVEEHCVKGRKVERLLYVNPDTKEIISHFRL